MRIKVKNTLLKTLWAAVFCVYSFQTLAGEADVVDVKVQHNGGDSFQFMATLRHADTGWKHYANAWEVLDMKGNVIGTRVLHHPHVNEQPFTRSLRLTIPAGINQVMVRAVDSVHSTGGKTMTVNLPR